MSIAKDIADIFERRAFCGGARCRLGGMSVAAAVLLMTFALPLPAAGQDAGEECEFHRLYLGSAGTVVLPHGGGDVRLLKHVFVGADNDPLKHAAGYIDGANSILTGISANISMKTGLPVNVDDLVKF